MGGFFGVVSSDDCVADLFYGTDYHSHLGTQRGGLVVSNRGSFTCSIHNITNAQFRSKFEDDLGKLRGTLGIGVISDYEDQPLIIGSHLGSYAIATVGRVNNITEIVGMEGEVVTTQDIFVFEQTGVDSNGRVKGRFRATGVRPMTLAMPSSSVRSPTVVPVPWPSMKSRSVMPWGAKR